MVSTRPHRLFACWLSLRCAKNCLGEHSPHLVSCLLGCRRYSLDRSLRRQPLAAVCPERTRGHVSSCLLDAVGWLYTCCGQCEQDAETVYVHDSKASKDISWHSDSRDSHFLFPPMESRDLLAHGPRYVLAPVLTRIWDSRTPFATTCRRSNNFQL